MFILLYLQRGLPVRHKRFDGAFITFNSEEELLNCASEIGDSFYDEIIDWVGQGFPNEKYRYFNIEVYKIEKLPFDTRKD